MISQKASKRKYILIGISSNNHINEVGWKWNLGVICNVIHFTTYYLHVITCTHVDETPIHACKLCNAWESEMDMSLSKEQGNEDGHGPPTKASAKLPTPRKHLLFLSSNGQRLN
jgi:hypothetical protein